MFFIIGLILAIAVFSDLSLSTIYSLALYMNGDVVFLLTVCIILAGAAKSALIPFTPWLAKAMEGPTSVSALLHSSTMVTVAIVKNYYMLENSIKNKFIKAEEEYSFIENLIKKSYHRFIQIFRINKQVLNSTSETTSNLMFNFTNYLKVIPLHKKNYDLDFIIWFIGFVEGDGSFFISNNKVYFDLTQHLSDIDLLYNIRTKLGFGKVLKRNTDNRNVAVYYVTGKENFIRLAHLFNGNLITPYKKFQFKKWLDCLNNQYNTNIILRDSELPVT